MTEPSREHGVEHEPHLQSRGHGLDPSERRAHKILNLNREAERETDADRVDHNVWEEPSLSPQLTDGPGEEQLTYQKWLQAGVKSTTFVDSMLVTLLVALASGPWGILGAFWSTMAEGGGLAASSLLAVVVFGPVAEEVVKVSAAWWVVEKRPYRFQSISQVLFCAACGGLSFAAIENLVYIYVYVPVHSEAFVAFRWSVCVALHVTCSLISGLGLARIWDNAMRNNCRPKIALGVPWLVIAMVGHGLYNLAVVIAEYAGWLDFLN